MTRGSIGQHGDDAGAARDERTADTGAHRANTDEADRGHTRYPFQLE